MIFSLKNNMLLDFSGAVGAVRYALQKCGVLSFFLLAGFSSTAMAEVQLIKDINPGLAGAQPKELAEYGGKFYFAADDGVNGQELWVSDGSEPGTAMLVDINPGNNKGAAPKEFTVFDGSLYFSANNGVDGRELWVTDGSADGTIMLKDIHPGTNKGSSPSDFIVHNGKLYFGADDGVNGRELWVSDGTDAGTVLAEDINLGAGGSSPEDFVVSGRKLYFQADDGLNGPELWRLITTGSCDFPLDAAEAEIVSVTDGKLMPSNADQAGSYIIQGGLSSTQAWAMASSGFVSGVGQAFDVSTGVVAVGLTKDLLPDVGAYHGVSTGDVAIQLVFFDSGMNEVGHVNYQRDSLGDWIGLGIGPGTDHFYQTDGSQVSFWFDGALGTFGAGYKDLQGNDQIVTRGTYSATSVTPVLAIYEQSSVDIAHVGEMAAATFYSRAENITAPVPTGALTPCGQDI